MRMYIALILCCAAQFYGTDKLRVYDDQQIQLLLNTSEHEEIAQVLSTIGVRFEKWEANAVLPRGASEQDIRDAYKNDIDRLCTENGYQHVDIVRMFPDNPKKFEFRNKFLNEHIHLEDEVRFFVEGSGLFYLHAGEKVYRVLCEEGDLISIPPRYTHWFDMGDHPHFTAIRFFLNKDGWIGHFTGSEISKKFFDEEFPEPKE